MGGDGGYIASRDLMVKTKKRQATETDPNAIIEEQLTHCALTGLLLSRPVVACELGNLFNKDAILSHLLSKQDVPAFRHIRGLKDLFNCSIVFESDHKVGQQGRVGIVVPPTASVTREMGLSLNGPALNHIVCPITDLKADGKHPFIVMRDCGCVLSLRAHTELNKNTQSIACVVCEKPISPKYIGGDVDEKDAAEVGELCYVTLVGSVDIVDRLRDVMMAKRVKAANKKDKKEKKEKKQQRSDDKSADDEHNAKRSKSNNDSLLRIPAKPKESNTNLINLDSTSSAISKEVEANLQKYKEQSNVFSELFNKK